MRNFWQATPREVFRSTGLGLGPELVEDGVAGVRGVNGLLQSNPPLPLLGVNNGEAMDEPESVNMEEELDDVLRMFSVDSSCILVSL